MPNEPFPEHLWRGRENAKIKMRQIPYNEITFLLDYEESPTKELDSLGIKPLKIELDNTWYCEEEMEQGYPCPIAIITFENDEDANLFRLASGMREYT